MTDPMQNINNISNVSSLQILIVDDNPDILNALELLLSLHGYRVKTADNQKQALLIVSHQKIDLVIQDMNFSQGETSGEEGKSLFSELKAVNNNLPIIVITAWAQLETAVELVKLGAADYLQKPWDDLKLLALVQKHSEVSTALPKVDIITNFIYQSSKMNILMSQALKVAEAEVNVLITGANGSGKEKLADYIHQHSQRNNADFVKVNMGALPHELMEAELFGAEKGAFTGANQARIGRFEAADGGTLFLDEIANLTLIGQMKLLRVLQTGEFERLGSNISLKVNVRVISATNVDLKEAIKHGTFREDLYYRLNVIELELPALNQRKADIIPLAQYFIGNKFTLSDEAKVYLNNYEWPGNVRELENACKRAQVFATDSCLVSENFTDDSLSKSIVNEKELIEIALRKHDGVIKHTALELALSRQALYRRIEKYNIDVKKLNLG